MVYRWKPEFCTKENCNYYLGGSYVPAPKLKNIDAYILTDSLVSVRKNDHGASIRVFVDVKENKVFLK